MSRYKAYPAYRDSGVDWFDSLPTKWDVKRISYIAQLQSGDAIVSEQIEAEGSYAVYGGNGLRGYSSNFNLEGDYILIGRQGALCGNINYGSGKFWASEHAVVVYPLFDVDIKWLGETLRSMNLNKYNVSAAQPGLAVTNITCLKIPFPSRDEQEKIAKFLDHETAKIDALIEKQQRLIELLKEKRQAVISCAVTKGLNPNAPMKDSGVEWLGEVPAHWEVATARRFLLEHKQGYYSTEDYVDDGVKLLRITDLRDLGEIDSSNSPRVKRTDALKIFLLRKGDVVFARTGGAGSFGVIPDQHEDLAYASYLIRFRFAHTYISYHYLRFMLASDNFQLAVKENIHGGVNQNLHAEDIKNTFIAVPPIEEQEQISTYLSRQSAKYSHLIAKAESTVELMQERRSALISAAVTGKIDVRDWQAST